VLCSWHGDAGERFEGGDVVTFGAPALGVAKEVEHRAFIDDVETWVEQNPEGSAKMGDCGHSCCIQ
jgi:hypothetical protein